ncbi:hypothetical protein [Streptomyces sp. NPDC057686]|uniref:hypothetical protein n=1 Tax=Streptomyces sp. NPDC057686 TaxID=3346212 RepID=UPI00367C8D8D
MRLSASRLFARAGYRIEVVVLAGREADTQQTTLVRHARALEHDVITALPTPAAHAWACRTAGDITVAVANDPSVATVLVLDTSTRPWDVTDGHPGPRPPPGTAPTPSGKPTSTRSSGPCRRSFRTCGRSWPASRCRRGP